jgi:hypothetical protein
MGLAIVPPVREVGEKAQDELELWNSTLRMNLTNDEK